MGRNRSRLCRSVLRLLYRENHLVECGRQSLPFQLIIHQLCFLCQSDGVQMKVAVEDG